MDAGHAVTWKILITLWLGPSALFLAVVSAKYVLRREEDD
jgi:hypothetical protein